jgi:YHS domain-containing protein
VDDFNDLDRRIQEQMATNEERARLRQNHVQRFMQEWQARLERYTEVADRLMRTVVRPRAERLKAHFPNATAPQEGNTRHSCVYQFAHTPQYPATVALELGISRSGEAKTLVVQYKLTILPTFFPFENNDQLCMPLDSVDEGKIARWVEDKIVGFVATYLRLETVEQYQTENTATDPVCGMQVTKTRAGATFEHAGKKFFFCLDECRARFAANPDRYLAPASRGKR